MIARQFVEEAIGKTIRNMCMVFAEPSGTRGSIGIKFDDNSGIMIEDAEQQCCEERYMTTDDDLSDFSGARLLGIEVKDVFTKEPEDPKSYMQHDVQFLEILTTKGVLSVASHNEHNGYYSGFKIIVKRWRETKNG